MSGELAQRGGAETMEMLSVQQIKAYVQKIEELYRSVMIEDVHYGKPFGGSGKMALLKPGAEKLLVTFMLAADPIVEDLSGPDFVKYRITARITHYPTGRFMGVGVGECSSDEEKYRWRASVCDEEFAATPEDRRRIKWKRAYRRGDPAEQVEQVRTNPADIANTVLKMGKKRALVDAALTVTSASDMFEQDTEDWGKEGPPFDAGEPGREQPEAPAEPRRRSARKDSPQKSAAQPARRSAPAQGRSAQASKSGSGGTISHKQINRIYAIARGNGWNEDEVHSHALEVYGYKSLDDIPNSRTSDDYDTICKWFEDNKPEEGATAPF